MLLFFYVCSLTSPPPACHIHLLVQTNVVINYFFSIFQPIREVQLVSTVHQANIYQWFSFKTETSNKLVVVLKYACPGLQF